MIEINPETERGKARLMLEMDQDRIPGEPIGERLRIAREAKGLSLDDVARQTRIPVRHLEHIEREEWESLPAITYSVGFVRSYANAVDLDGPALGAELREQLGATRIPGAATAYYEPADPARVPPRWIAVAAALLAVLIVAAYLVWRHNAVGDADVIVPPVAEAPPAATSQAPRPAAPAPANASGPVTLTAAEDVWLRIYEAGSPKSIYQGLLKAGQSYQVPATAQAPQIRTGRANVLRVTVGSTAIPPLGPPEKMIKDVSLRPADLVARLQANPAPAGAAPAAPAPAAVPPAQ
jgi:cytoskeleton protein RodZ